MEKTVTIKDANFLVMPSITRVAAYARVSSGKDEMLHSLAAQVNHYSKYIQQHPGWFYAGVYADEAITGTKNNRQEFMRLIKDCHSKKVDLILTKSISRFARNTVTLLKTVRELKEIGVDVYFEEQNIHSISDDGELMLTILASYAQEESLSVSENCKWRIRKQFEKGELTNLRFMYGYKIIKEKVEIDPIEAEIVRMIFADYIDGMGSVKIAKKLNATNVDTMFNSKWSSGNVMAILKNEKYTGNALLQKRFVLDHLSKKVVSNKGDLPKYFAGDTHPAIIDQNTFDLAQSTLQTKSGIYKTNSNPRKRYPFSGLIKCGICGKSYKRKLKNNKAAWQCSTFLREGKSACPAKQIPESILYSLSNDVLNLDSFDPDIFEEEIAEILVPAFNKLVFIFKDGHAVEKRWQYKSRSVSWTTEMRDAARKNTEGRT